MNVRKLSLLTLAATGLVFAGAASAQSRTYNFDDRSTPTGACLASVGSYGSNGNAIGCQAAGVSGGNTLTVTGWSTDGTTPAQSYRAGAVNDQSGNGFGLTAATDISGSPNHAADNMSPGGVDMFLLNFTTSQALKSVTLGWAGEDGDFQVLRWGGSGSVTSVTGKTAGQLITDGWVLMNAGGSNTVFNGVGAAGGNDSNQLFTFNSGDAMSTSWIISAYNSSWAGSGATHVGAGDAIKVLTITTASPTGVSAPGTLALAGLGLLGAGVLRRRNAA